jgi:hypothetical protein
MIAGPIFLTSKGQAIAMSRTKATNSIEVVNGGYTLNLAIPDILAGIAKIDQVLKTDHHELSANISAHKWTTVNLKTPRAVDTSFVNFLKANLGCYLLLHGKATIYKGPKLVTSIIGDDGPPEVEDDGSASFPIFFSEQGSDEQIFLGHMSTKLK